MISAIAWIPRGAAKEEPEQAEIENDDAEAMLAAAQADAQAASGVGMILVNSISFESYFHMLFNSIYYL